MATTKTPTPSQIAKALVKGLDAVHRPRTDKVRECYHVRANGRNFIEVLCATATRVNVCFKHEPPAAARKLLEAGTAQTTESGKPLGGKSFPGGILYVESLDAVASARKVIDLAIAAAPAATEKTPPKPTKATKKTKSTAQRKRASRPKASPVTTSQTEPTPPPVRESDEPLSIDEVAHNDGVQVAAA